MCFCTVLQDKTDSTRHHMCHVLTLLCLVQPFLFSRVFYWTVLTSRCSYKILVCCTDLHIQFKFQKCYNSFFMFFNMNEFIIIYCVSNSYLVYYIYINSYLVFIPTTYIIRVTSSKIMILLFLFLIIYSWNIFQNKL